MTGPLYVAVCGPDPASPAMAAHAEEVGRLLARAGAVLVCGGLGGTMEAAARGCSSEGGVSLGILPDARRERANRYLTYSIPSGMGEMRNALVVRAADVVIAIAGEFGTLSEIAFALKTGKPVIGLSTWELAKEGRPVDPLARAGTPEEAVRLALHLAGRAGGEDLPPRPTPRA
jgi:uncharacterized protein (TIGR00725 family)